MDTFNKVDIYDNEEKIILSSNQVSIYDNRISLFGDFPVLLSHGTRVNATGFLDDGFTSFTGKVSLSVESQINLTDIELGEKMDRRNFLKVKVPFDGILLMGYEIVNGKKTLLTDESIKIRDISIGGVGFYFNKSLIKKQKILMQLDSVKPDFVVEAIVLRKEKIRHEQYKFRYGCRFLSLDNIQQSVLCKYVFKTQLETRKKAPGFDDDEEIDVDSDLEAEVEE
ncbi:MAG: PilZ domain-containing protein [Eubacteriales bacterium]|nr:PilZ domain-containing protein [Eubacteriales bacterium]